MSRQAGDRVKIVVEEPSEPQTLDRVLAYAAMAPLIVGALGGFLLRPQFAFLAPNLALLWAAAILVFLAGVRRGVSFRTPGGPTMRQIATVLWLFVLGTGAHLAIVWGFSFLATGLCLAGYISIAALDPAAARRGEAPLFFARLRPLQMTILILALLLIGVKTGGFA